jgi:hypothetical protein
LRTTRSSARPANCGRGSDLTPSSGHPHAVEPVTPVRDFDLARYSFVESIDVVAGLDSRSDPTKMTPTEFEHLVRQLFEARGLEGWTTDRVGDDGVDAVVVNRDPDVGAGSRLLRQAIHRDRREGSTVGEIEEIARRFAREEIAGGRRRAEGLSSVRFSEFQWRHGGR